MKTIYNIEGLSCAACAASSKYALSKMDGIHDVNVNFANKKVWVDFDEVKVDFDKMNNQIAKLGFELKKDTAEVRQEQAIKEAQRLKNLQLKVTVGVVISVVMMLLSMVFTNIPYANWIMLVLSFPMLFWIGKEFFVNAWKKAMAGTTNMDTLVALGTGTAFLFSVFNTIFPEFLSTQGLEAHVYYETAGVLITLILLGRWLEERAKKNTSLAIQKLLNLRSKTALVFQNEEYRPIPIEMVSVGDKIMIQPGNQIPVDGVLLEGEGNVDESMITGEPLPVVKMVNDKVIGGTINQNSNLIIQAEKVGEATMLSKIIKMVEEAQGSQAPIQKLVDQISAIFVPAVILIATLTFGIWWYFMDIPHAIVVAVTVLIIACPCALGLATPTAIMVGIGKGAQKGILIKSAESLEQIKNIDTIVLDKTGTITTGKPEVTKVEWSDNIDRLDHTINEICAIESFSQHPLSKAVLNHFDIAPRGVHMIQNFQNFTGKGLTATFAGQQYLIGNQKLMSDHQVKCNSDANILVAKNNQVIGKIWINDILKESSKQAVKQLQDEGIDVHILSGDKKENVERVAQLTGIQNFKASVLPEQKLLYIQKLQEQDKQVAMVGDGINDAPALAQANVGISIGQGTDIAIETADITLLKGDLKRLADAILISKKTVKTIRQNLFWAFIYNIIGIPIAAGLLYPPFGFLLNPMIAGAAMAMSSVSVVLNSLRISKSVK